MTDSEKLDAILKMVSEIRKYIGSRPDCPQHLWTQERYAAEVARQGAALHTPFQANQSDTSMQAQQAQNLRS